MMNAFVNADETSAGLSVVQQKVNRAMGKKVSDEDRIEAIRRVTEGQESVSDVASDMGFSTSAIHNWKRSHMKDLEDKSEIARLKERLRVLEDVVQEKNEEIIKLHNDVDYERRSKSEILQELIKSR